jgi:hypothetical protein
VVISRHGFSTRVQAITDAGRCGQCGSELPVCTGSRCLRRV